jgi:hypothetical protein
MDNETQAREDGSNLDTSARPQSEASRKDKPFRINVTLSAENYDELRTAAAAAGMDLSEFVRNAIRIYYFLRTEKKQGKRVYIGTDEKVEKELLVP